MSLSAIELKTGLVQAPMMGEPVHPHLKRNLFWLILCAGMIVCMVWGYRFLAVNHPLGEGVLVVEGWIPAKTLVASVPAFRSGKYQYLLAVGGPIAEPQRLAERATTYAELAAIRLEQSGMDTGKLIKIEVPRVTSNRTFTEALKVKEWIDHSETKVCCVDIFTTGAHARKSWILSEHVLGQSCRVGIIAGPELRFNPRYWFLSMTGNRLVIRNIGAYVYYKAWILSQTWSKRRG